MGVGVTVSLPLVNYLREKNAHARKREKDTRRQGERETSAVPITHTFTK